MIPRCVCLAELGNNTGHIAFNSGYLDEWFPLPPFTRPSITVAEGGSTITRTPKAGRRVAFLGI